MNDALLEASGRNVHAGSSAQKHFLAVLLYAKEADQPALATGRSGLLPLIARPSSE